MASLKEIRSRIASVSSTHKITSAMKMVSAAKLKKAQNTIESGLQYREKLTGILYSFIAAGDGASMSPISEIRDVKRVAIVAVSSNSSLCGAFNSNVTKLFKSTYKEYSQKVGTNNIDVYPIGKKIELAVRKMEINSIETGIDISEKMDYQSVVTFCNKLMKDFCDKKIDEVVLLYNHFKNAGVQIVTKDTLLPFVAKQEDAKIIKSNTDYIVEPNKVELVNELIPKVVRLQLYSTLQDSLAAEHGARTTAMQIATENAESLIQELTLNYNKLRQAAITTEIITIIGGAEAIK